MPLRRTVAALLEEAALPSALTWLPSQAYSLLASGRIARAMRLPDATDVIGVGGAVLGGAGKTPVVIAYAKALIASGKRVAVVAHGYRAAPKRVRRVLTTDRVDEVGDDALLMARALNDGVTQVWVGPNREQTVLHAAHHADTILVDGLLQTRPTRLTRSLLVLDARHPWGSGRAVPAGDLRADPKQLLAASDQVVLVYDPAIGHVGDMGAAWPGAIRAKFEITAFSTELGTVPIHDGIRARLGSYYLSPAPTGCLPRCGLGTSAGCAAGWGQTTTPLDHGIATIWPGWRDTTAWTLGS